MRSAWCPRTPNDTNTTNNMAAANVRSYLAPSAIQAHIIALPSGRVGAQLSSCPAAGPPGRMAPRRLLAAQVLLDPETASAAELLALPDVGPHLARHRGSAECVTVLRFYGSERPNPNPEP